jgi:hypothetical protein
LLFIDEEAVKEAGEHYTAAMMEQMQANFGDDKGMSRMAKNLALIYSLGEHVSGAKKAGYRIH